MRSCWYVASLCPWHVKHNYQLIAKMLHLIPTSLAPWTLGRSSPQLGFPGQVFSNILFGVGPRLWDASSQSRTFGYLGSTIYIDMHRYVYTSEEVCLDSTCASSYFTGIMSWHVTCILLVFLVVCGEFFFLSTFAWAFHNTLFFLDFYVLWLLPILLLLMRARNIF
jgi:hypothetical protein